MSERRQPGVIGSLPSTRPHRRSAKRGPAAEPDGAPARVPEEGPAEARPARATKAKRPAPERAAARKPRRATPAAARTHASERPRARPPRTPPAAAEREPAPGALQTAVEAAVELTEIGLRIGAQALRTALSRLPRP